MSEITIHVPRDQIADVRESLQAAPRGGAAADELLGQIEAQAGTATGATLLTGPRALLWRALYDSACGAAERVADECNEYWRGTVSPIELRGRISSLAARFELLVSLGGPPAG